MDHRTHCAIVKPIIMMRLQNYAGCRTKRDVAESAPQADTQSVCIIHTTVDYISTDTEHCLS